MSTIKLAFQALLVALFVQKVLVYIRGRRVCVYTFLFLRSVLSIATEIPGLASAAPRVFAYIAARVDPPDCMVEPGKEIHLDLEAIR